MYVFTWYVARASLYVRRYVGRDFFVLISTSHFQNCTSGVTEQPRRIQYCKSRASSSDLIYLKKRHMLSLSITNNKSSFAMLPCTAKLTTRPIILRPDGVGATLEDLPPTVFPLQCVQDLFTFSPFGLSCRQCEKQVQIKFDERCIRDHLKKHCMDSRMSTVRSLLLRISEQAIVIKATGTINSFRHDEKAYIGYVCVCGQSFPRKDNALRHCKKSTCDDLQLQKVELIRLCCVCVPRPSLSFLQRSTSHHKTIRLRRGESCFVAPTSTKGKTGWHIHSYVHPTYFRLWQWQTFCWKNQDRLQLYPFPAKSINWGTSKGANLRFNPISEFLP